MPKCKWCGQEMLIAKGCVKVPFPIKGVGFLAPLKVGEQDKVEPGERCSDCGAMYGNYHHPGCDNEICPKCGRQAATCGCAYSIAVPSKLSEVQSKITSIEARLENGMTESREEAIRLEDELMEYRELENDCAFYGFYGTKYPNPIESIRTLKAEYKALGAKLSFKSGIPINSAHLLSVWYGGDICAVRKEGFKLIISAEGENIIDGDIAGNVFSLNDTTGAGAWATEDAAFRNIITSDAMYDDEYERGNLCVKAENMLFFRIENAEGDIIREREEITDTNHILDVMSGCETWARILDTAIKESGEKSPSERDRHASMVRAIHKNVDGCGTDIELFVRIEGSNTTLMTQKLKENLHKCRVLEDCTTEEIVAEAAKKTEEQTGGNCYIVSAPYSKTLEF